MLRKCIGLTATPSKETRVTKEKVKLKLSKLGLALLENVKTINS